MAVGKKFGEAIFSQKTVVSKKRTNGHDKNPADACTPALVTSLGGSSPEITNFYKKYIRNKVIWRPVQTRGAEWHGQFLII